MKSDSNDNLAARGWKRVRQSQKKIAGWGALCLLFLVVTYAFYSWSMQSGINALRASSNQRLEVYVSSLESVLGKYDYLPSTLDHNKDVLDLLQRPEDPESVATVNRYLEKLNEQVKANTIYILDLNGVTLASSNWNKPHSFVGVDLAFRPYIKNALDVKPGRFYAIGTTSNEAGYYFAHGIYRNGKIIGVTTVKVSLEKLEKAWSQSADKIMLVDENNVIFLSSLAPLKYKTLGTLSQETINRLNDTHQYHKQRLDPIYIRDAKVFADGTRVISLQQGEGQSALEPRQTSYLLTQGKSLMQPDWRFLFLSDLTRVQKTAFATSAFAAVMFGFLMFLFLYLRQRHLAILHSVKAKEALQHAYDNLEVMVADRTSELELTTQELIQEIAERRQAQQTLQTTQEELIQAGKMAVLGQMSAGITHELNQPLTALRTMSDNALVLLERGLIDEASKNLSVVSQIVDRMGTITRQLKVFARKSSPALTVVSVRSAISNSVFLVERRLQLENVMFTQNIPAGDVFVLGENNRLEQVLVNLFNNALDSMANSTVRCLRVDVHETGGRAFIKVEDNGAGLPEEVLQHLFEPFFTTKDQSAGLGLGLVISAQIVREFGGVLSGQNSSDTGAVFTVELRAAQPATTNA